jgi:D-glycero-D-manno-heptose 1,7-bisphosphate phosphatase
VSGGSPAVFLDRDGTLVEDVHYLDAVDRLKFFPYSVDAVRALNRAGLTVVLVSNQSGVARGFFPESAVWAVHDRIAAELAAAGAAINAYYYCPHHPEGTVAEFARPCGCRKPAPGMIERAAADWSLDPSRSFVVGDTWTDVGLARAVGARAVLVRTGHGREALRTPDPALAADAVADNLIAAVTWILRHL